MIKFKVVRQGVPEFFEEEVSSLLNEGYGISWLGAVAGGNSYIYHVAYLSKEA